MNSKEDRKSPIVFEREEWEDTGAEYTLKFSVEYWENRVSRKVCKSVKSLVGFADCIDMAEAMLLNEIAALSEIAIRLSEARATLHE
jgi:hypothetical protein